MVRRLRESKDYRDVILDKYKFRHYLVGSQYQLWNDADFDKVISALRKMEKVRDEVERLRASMFVDKCIREADANAGITDATYPDYTEVIMQYPELKAIADKYGLEYYLEGKRTMNKRSKRLREDFDDAVDKSAIIQKFEDYGFFQDDPKDPRYFYDGMPFRFYATYDSENDVAYIDFNPAGNAVEVYYANINSVDDADAFLQKLYDWEEYDSFDLLEMGLIAFGFRKGGAWSYIGQNDFGEDILVDFNADEMTLLDDGYGEEQTLSIFDGFDEFIAR